MAKKRIVNTKKSRPVLKHPKRVKSKIEEIKWFIPPMSKEESLPLLFSKRDIIFFSFLFSILFGAVLMVMNLRSLKKPEGVIPVISISFSYLISVILVVKYLESYFHSKLPGSYLFSFLGAWLILDYAWDKYIGEEIKYQKRGRVIPLIVGVFISAIYLFIIFS